MLNFQFINNLILCSVKLVGVPVVRLTMRGCVLKVIVCLLVEASPGKAARQPAIDVTYGTVMSKSVTPREWI